MTTDDPGRTGPTRTPSPRPTARAAATSSRRVAATAAKPRKRPARRKPKDPAGTWARGLARRRPGLVDFVLDGLRGLHGLPTWSRWHDPTSELMLTILTQNSADVNAEKAYEALRLAYPRNGAAGTARTPDAPVSDMPGADVLTTRPGWGGRGLEEAEEPDWAAVEVAPIEELVEVIRPGGLAPQKAPRLQAALRTIREASGGHSLEFLGERPPLEARAWLTAIDGIGPKTASVVLMFSFGMPLMPVDRHVERVSQRIGLIPTKGTAADAHDLYLALLPPDRMYEAHVNLITHGRRVCHARKPDCGACPIAPRCRFVDRKAP